MRVHGMGLDLAGRPLIQPEDELTFSDSLISTLPHTARTVQNLTQMTAEAVTFRNEIERELLDPGDPRAAGWSFLLNSTDPLGQEIRQLLEPLAEHRGMANPAAPFLFSNETQEEWFDWLQDNYYALKLQGEHPPQYILIVGGPDQVPFRFQSILNTVANVGRVTFDQLADLETYVDKLIRIENALEPIIRKEVVVFSPDAGLPDATYFSKRYMAEPLAHHIQEDLGFDIHALLGREATKGNLSSVLSETSPALVYSASHGMGAFDQPLEVQKQLNGAICCQKTGREHSHVDWLYSANDIPSDQPFLEGAVVFQFACFGYGTPAESDFAHWLPGSRDDYSGSDFVAALPKKLLAHPRGPIGFIGHLDTAYLHGFADVEDRHILARWHTRITPFVDAVEQILGTQPTGLSMRNLLNRYSLCNALITNTYDRIQRGRLTWNEELKARFLDNWITRSDAQNYMIFGDPAARPRIKAS